MSTQSVCLFALEIRCTVCSYGTSTAYFVTYVTIRGTMNYAYIKAYVLVIFSLFANLCVCFNTKLHKNIPNVDFMVILMKFATCHVRNAFKRPLRPNAPTVRVLTSVILKGIGWAFRKLYPYTRVYWLLKVYCYLTVIDAEILPWFILLSIYKTVVYYYVSMEKIRFSDHMTTRNQQ